ncbi:MAG: hypothetical protein GEU78_16250 [Actinobacteria bacterium]|nr:hypothetical protein [Actinomycetota bacterium]
MKLSDVVLGQQVGVPRTSPTDVPATIWGYDLERTRTLEELVRRGGDTEITSCTGYYRATVRDVGVPYKKGRGGVVVEVTWELRQWHTCRCNQCGDDHIPDSLLDAPEDERYHPSQVRHHAWAVHHTAIWPWEELLAEEVVWHAEWVARRAAHR